MPLPLRIHLDVWRTSIIRNCGTHGIDDGIGDVALMEIVQLLCGEIKVNRRILNTANDGSFGKPSRYQVGDRIVGQCRRTLKLCSGATGFGRGPHNLLSSAAAVDGIVLN